jgi:sporulation integral membrane protein YlbJ
MPAKRTIGKAVLVFFLLLTAVCSKDAAAAAKLGIDLCLNSVIPSLFPFFVISGLCTAFGLDGFCRFFSPLMTKLFHLRPALATPLLLGFLGGYPVCAVTLSELLRTGQASRPEAERLLSFGNNTGPAFAISVCGVGIFGSVPAGAVLYGIHILSALMTGMVLCRAKSLLPFHGQTAERADPPAAKAITGSIQNAVSSALSITAFVTFFAVVLALLQKTGVLSLLSRCVGALTPLSGPEALAAVTGALEMTNGLYLLSPALPFAFPLCAAILSFGGLSVFFQTAGVLPPVRLAPMLRGKALHAALAFVLAVLCRPFLFA